MEQANYNKIIATIILVLISVLLLVAIFPYRNAFFGAFIFYILCYPLFSWLRKRGHSKKSSAWIVILLTLIIILLPLILILPAAISQVGDIANNQDAILQMVETLDERIPQHDLKAALQNVIIESLRFVQRELGNFVSSATEFLITFLIMYFLLYFLFINTSKVTKLKALLPFNKKHSKILIDEFSQVAKTTIFSTGLIAIFQGALLGIGLFIAGVPGSLFLGFAGVILSFIPIVGIPFIWIPATIYLVVTQQWVGAVFILVLGLILSNIDNVIRPILQNKIGKIHPLTSILGVFIGLPLFGIIGIVIGPLLISYFFLIVDMYIKEFVK